MKIVKNGRLFGKLNIVDVLILLVVIAAVSLRPLMCWNLTRTRLTV